MAYVLKGRSFTGKPIPKDQDLPNAPCIFCGTEISHFNDGGVGWWLNALVNGRSKDFLYCDQPPCKEAKQYAEQDIFRCGCVSDYTESVGTRCAACKRPRTNLVPVRD